MGHIGLPQKPFESQERPQIWVQAAREQSLAPPRCPRVRGRGRGGALENRAESNSVGQPQQKCLFVFFFFCK